MVKKLLYLPIRAIAILAGFLFVINLPSLLGFNSEKGSIELHFSNFIKNFIHSFMSLIHMDGLTQLISYFEEDGMHRYLYTMSILSSSILAVSVIGIIAATAIMMFPTKLRKGTISLVNFTATTPELLAIFLLQYLVIYVYKTYNLKLFQLYGFFNAEPKFAPIFIASFLPTIFFIQLILKEFLNEELQDYVLFARSKGLTYRIIYIKHIFWNIFPFCLIHFRIIIWFLLTNIFVMESLFLVKGYMEGLYQLTGIAYLIGLLLFSIPIFIANGLAKLGTFLINRKEKISL